MQSPFAYKCGAQETAAPKQQNSPANPHDSAELQLLGQTEYFNFQSFFKERKLSAYSHYTSRQTGDQSYSFVQKQVCENLTGNRGYKNNINRRNLLQITNFQQDAFQNNAPYFLIPSTANATAAIITIRIEGMTSEKAAVRTASTTDAADSPLHEARHIRSSTSSATMMVFIFSFIPFRLIRVLPKNHIRPADVSALTVPVRLQKVSPFPALPHPDKSVPEGSYAFRR